MTTRSTSRQPWGAAAPATRRSCVLPCVACAALRVCGDAHNAAPAGGRRAGLWEGAPASLSRTRFDAAVPRRASCRATTRTRGLCTCSTAGTSPASSGSRSYYIILYYIILYYIYNGPWLRRRPMRAIDETRRLLIGAAGRRSCAVEVRCRGTLPKCIYRIALYKCAVEVRYRSAATEVHFRSAL